VGRVREILGGVCWTMSELSLSKILTPIDATQPSMLFKTG